jgi:hypothetical protein
MRSAIGKLIITTLATVLLVEICYAQATGGGGRYGPALSRGCRKRGFDGSLSKSDGAELGTYFGGRRLAPQVNSGLYALLLATSSSAQLSSAQSSPSCSASVSPSANPSASSDTSAVASSTIGAAAIIRCSSSGESQARIAGSDWPRLAFWPAIDRRPLGLHRFREYSHHCHDTIRESGAYKPVFASLRHLGGRDLVGVNFRPAAAAQRSKRHNN